MHAIYLMDITVRKHPVWKGSNAELVHAISFNKKAEQCCYTRLHSGLTCQKHIKKSTTNNKLASSKLLAEVTEWIWQ